MERERELRDIANNFKTARSEEMKEKSNKNGHLLRKPQRTYGSVISKMKSHAHGI